MIGNMNKSTSSSMTKPGSRIGLIEAITAPLGFFVLALLIVEASLTVVLVGSDLPPSDKAMGMYLVVSLFVLVALFVFVLVWFKPRNLTFDKVAHLDSEKNIATYDRVNQLDEKQKTMGYKEHAVRQVENLRPRATSSLANVPAIAANRKDALVIVDVQNDFFTEGSLPVPESEALIEPLNRAIKLAEESGFLVVFTQDWHPISHSSFEDNGGDWKPHCISDTNGAALHSGLYQPREATYVRFGVEPEMDGYSPYENPKMDQLLNNSNIGRIFVSGIALEYCVFATCKQTRERNRDVIAVESLIRAAVPDRAEETWAKLTKLGVKREPEFRQIANKNG